MRSSNDAPRVHHDSRRRDGMAAGGQQAGKLPIIGFLGGATASGWSTWIAAFVQRLRELGWIEGRTVVIEYIAGRRDAATVTPISPPQPQGRCHRSRREPQWAGERVIHKRAGWAMSDENNGKLS